MTQAFEISSRRLSKNTTMVQAERLFSLQSIDWEYKVISSSVNQKISISVVLTHSSSCVFPFNELITKIHRKNIIREPSSKRIFFRKIYDTIEKDILRIRIHQKYTVIRHDCKYLKILEIYI